MSAFTTSESAPKILAPHQAAPHADVSKTLWTMDDLVKIVEGWEETQKQQAPVR